MTGVMVTGVIVTGVREEMPSGVVVAGVPSPGSSGAVAFSRGSGWRAAAAADRRVKGRFPVSSASSVVLATLDFRGRPIFFGFFVVGVRDFLPPLFTRGVGGGMSLVVISGVRVGILVASFTEI